LQLKEIKVTLMNYVKVLMLSMTFLALLGVLSAAAGVENLKVATYCLYTQVKGILAVGMLLLVVLAAIVYSIGQVLGAETRARASVWATAMFVGAIIGAIIFIILPYVLQLLFQGDEQMLQDLENPGEGITCG
jgi:hypothetical protein